MDSDILEVLHSIRDLLETIDGRLEALNDGQIDSVRLDNQLQSIKSDISSIRRN